MRKYKEKREEQNSMDRKKVRALALLTAAFCLLTACGKGDDEGEDPGNGLPETYAVGGEEVVLALSAEGNVGLKEGHITLYTYEGLTDAGAAAEAYVARLMTRDEGAGFSAVDEEFVRTEDRPDFTLPEGEILLAKNWEPPVEEDSKKSDEEEDTEPVDMVLTVRVSWTEGSCIVALREMEGKVTSPPPDPSTQTQATPSISGDEAMDRLRSFTPADLGLEGTSMESFNIYLLDGSVLVDNKPCFRMNVYSTGRGTNEFAGCFLMTSDGLGLYRLDPVSDTIVKVDMP